MKYSVRRRGKAIVEPTELALKVGVSWLNGREVSQLGAEVKAEERKVEGTLATPIYKKSTIDLAANETKVDFGDWSVRLHARRFPWRVFILGDSPSDLVASDAVYALAADSPRSLAANDTSLGRVQQFTIWSSLLTVDVSLV